MDEIRSPQELISDLQKKIRNVSADRKRYTDSAMAERKEQTEKIKKLQKAIQTLKNDIQNMQKSKEPRPMTRSSTLIDTPETLLDKISKESSSLKKVDDEIKSLQGKLFIQREKSGGINASRDNANALNKQMRILENRLDKANQKFNEAIAQNKVLREEIDNLRRERQIFDNIYQKLEKELQNKRKEMAKKIEEANTAYEQRDKAQEELQKIKGQSKKEQEEFEQEWKNLNKLIEQDKKMKDFLKFKMQEKEQADNIDLPRNEEEVFKKKNKLDPQVISAERVKSYEEAFNKIQSATGIQDIDELVETFIKAEDKNFTLFKFVNELSNDIETLEKQIQDLQIEIEKCKLQDEPGFVATTKQAIDEKIEKYMQKTERCEKEYEEKLQYLNSIKDEVNKFFYSIDCHKHMASEFLGETVTENNIGHFLTLVEQRCEEVYRTYMLMQLQSGKSEFSMPGNQGPAGRTLQKIDCSMILDENAKEGEDDVNDSRPLTREEFMKKAEELCEKSIGIPKPKIQSNKNKLKK